MEQIGGFPRNLSYNLKKMASGSIIKQKIKINSDLTSYNSGGIINFYLPIGRMIDLRSIVIYALGKTSKSGTYDGVHFPRFGLHSLIEQLQISVNNKPLQSTNFYNYIYNLIADIEGYSSIEQATKRITELPDPTIYYNAILDDTKGTGTNNDTTGITNTLNLTRTANDTTYFCANNFLGFFNSSVSTIDTNNLGQVKISITLAPSSCLWLGVPSATNLPTGGDYTLEKVYLTLDTITFTNSLYYDLVKSQLEGGGLNIAYYDYIATSLNSVDRGNGIACSTQINANSLDQVYFTARPSNYTTQSKLVIGKQTYADAKSFNALLSDTTSANNGYYCLFNNSRYFIRDGAGFQNGSWYINSQPFTQQANAMEVFNNLLQSTNYGNLDIASGGLHGGCISLAHFARHYFVDCISLENQSSDNNWWVSGLGGNGGTITIQYNCNYSSTTSSDTDLTSKIIPYLICRVSKILNVKMGRALDLME